MYQILLSLYRIISLQPFAYIFQLTPYDIFFGGKKDFMNNGKKSQV